MLCNEGRLFTATRFDGTEEEVKEQWHAKRRSGIGGSDVAAIMGLSPWSSPLETWLEKTNRVEAPDISGKESVRMGVELEDDVLAMYKRRHPEARAHKCNAILTSIYRPWAQASLDGVTHDKELGTGVLEIKTSSREDEWKDGVPIHYLTQVTHYMSVTGWRYADVAALVGDRGLHYHEYRVFWDDEDMEAVVTAVDEFWSDYVEKDVMPTVMTGGQGESKAIYEMYKRSDQEMTPLEETDAMRLAGELYAASASEKEAQKRKKQAANSLKLLIGEHKGLRLPGYVATWVRSDKRDQGVRVRKTA